MTSPILMPASAAGDPVAYRIRGNDEWEVCFPYALDYLGEGNRRVDSWYARHRMARADFSTSPQVFLNLNTPQDKQLIERMLTAAQAGA